MSQKRMIGAGAAAACIAMVAFPQVAMLSAQKGIALWVGSVLPALFPFFICVNYLHGAGITRRLPPSLFAFGMSVISGYPTGAKMIGDMRASGCITAEKARHMIAFCSTSGPTFMIGAVGVGMLGSVRAGLVLAAAHYGAALINGLVFRTPQKGGIHGDKRSVPVQAEGKAQRPPRVPAQTTCFVADKTALELFTDSIFGAFRSMGIILAYLILFMFLTDLIQFTGLLRLLPQPWMKGVFRGLFEMTLGASTIAGCAGLSLTMKTALCAGIISFGGFSVIGQSMSMLFGSGVTVCRVLLTKMFHALFAFLFACVCGILIL